MNKLKELIERYEDEKVSLEFTLSEIEMLTGKSIDEYELNNYWRFEDLENFIKRLEAKPIDDWQSITDEEALRMIKQIFDNTTETSVMEPLVEALEKRFGKPSGTIINYIFQDDLSEDEVFQNLKKETRILL